MMIADIALAFPLGTLVTRRCHSFANQIKPPYFRYNLPNNHLCHDYVKTTSALKAIFTADDC